MQHSPRQSSNSSLGFTLVELLVVISIIGILAGLLLTNFTGIRGRASDSTRKSDMQQVKKALRLYYNDHQNYPGAGSQNLIHGCGVNAWDRCDPGTQFSAGSEPTIYMKKLPPEYTYYSDQSERFVLFVTLENVSDEDIAKSQAACSANILALSAPVQESDYVVCED